MENKIDATFSAADRDQVLDLIHQICALFYRLQWIYRRKTGIRPLKGIIKAAPLSKAV